MPRPARTWRTCPARCARPGHHGPAVTHDIDEAVYLADTVLVPSRRQARPAWPRSSWWTSRFHATRSPPRRCRSSASSAAGLLHPDSQAHLRGCRAAGRRAQRGAGQRRHGGVTDSHDNVLTAAGAEALVHSVLESAAQLRLRVSVGSRRRARFDLLVVRGDGASWFTPDVARTKARTAAAFSSFGEPSRAARGSSRPVRPARRGTAVQSHSTAGRPARAAGRPSRRRTRGQRCQPRSGRPARVCRSVGSDTTRTRPRANVPPAGTAA